MKRRALLDRARSRLGRTLGRPPPRLPSARSSPKPPYAGEQVGRGRHPARSPGRRARKPGTFPGVPPGAERRLHFRMTDRLYLDDPYLVAFEAALVAERRLLERRALVLSRTAFYPEGGGQPA